MTTGDILFSAKGRISRRTWWLYTIIYIICVVTAEFATIYGAKNASLNIGSIHFTAFQCYMIALSTLGQWPTVCLNAKRWHDRGRSGYLAAVNPGIALINLMAILFFPTAMLPVMSMLMVIGGLYGLWVIIDCGCLPGMDGDNRYGPSPKADGQAAIF